MKADEARRTTREANLTWTALPKITVNSTVALFGVRGQDRGLTGSVIEHTYLPIEEEEDAQMEDRSTLITDETGSYFHDAKFGNVRIPEVIDMLTDKPVIRALQCSGRRAEKVMIMKVTGPSPTTNESTMEETNQSMEESRNHDAQYVGSNESSYLNLDIDEDRFIPREIIVNAITAQLGKSLNDNDNDRKHHNMKQFMPDDGNIEDICNAVTAGLEGLMILEAVADEDAPPTPANYNEAMILDPQGWRASMVEEIGTLASMKCWDLVRESEMQPGDNLTGSTWSYKVKPKQHLFRKKSRACGRGFSQEFGRDYFEVYSGVVTAESLRLAIALAAVNKRILKSYDIKSAYIWAFLPAADRVFMKQLPGFAIENVNDEADRQLLEWFKDIGMKVPENVQPGEKLVCRIRRALYGLKSSARLHYANVAAWFIQEGFKVLNSDDCIFVHHNEEEDIDVEIYLYVDDLLESSANEKSSNWFREKYEAKWHSSPGSGGLTQFLLSMDMIHNEETDGIIINQGSMITKIAKKFTATDQRAWTTPMASDFDPTFDEGEPMLNKDEYNFRSLIGAILFVVTHSRPDCSTATSILCSCLAKPQKKHWKAGIRLIAYLYQTKELGLSYSSKIHEDLWNKPLGYVDAAWASEKGSKSRGGHVVKVNGAAVSYQSKLIKSICLSSAEAETSAAIACLKDIIWLRTLLYELGYPQPGSTEVFEDSQAMIGASSNNAQTKASRYYQLRTAFIRQLVKSGTVHLTYVDTQNQVADTLSKNLGKEAFQKHQIGLLGPQPEMLHKTNW